jgi:hypothetical protein
VSRTPVVGSPRRRHPALGRHPARGIEPAGASGITGACPSSSIQLVDAASRGGNCRKSRKTVIEVPSRVSPRVNINLKARRSYGGRRGRDRDDVIRTSRWTPCASRRTVVVAVGSKMDGRRGTAKSTVRPNAEIPRRHSPDGISYLSRHAIHLSRPSSSIQHTDTLARVPTPSSTDVEEDGGPSRVTTSRAGLTSLAIAPDGSINAVSLF